MRLLKLVAVAVLATGLLQLAPAPPAQAFTLNCGWRTLSYDFPLLRGYTGELRAGPLVEVGATSVDVTCQLRRGASDGPVILDDTQNTPGSAGVYQNIWHLYYDFVPGEEVYVCTYTKAYPSNIRTFRGCSLAFVY